MLAVDLKVSEHWILVVDNQSDLEGGRFVVAGAQKVVAGFVQELQKMVLVQCEWEDILAGRKVFVDIGIL